MELRELVDSIADEIYKVMIKNKQQNKDKQTIKLDGSKIYFDDSVGKISGNIEIEYVNKEEYDKQEEKIQQVIEEGKKLIYPFRYENWEKTVRDSFNSPLYKGKDIYISLAIMQALEDKNIKGSKKLYEDYLREHLQEENCVSILRLVRKNVMTFSKDGYLFYKFTSGRTWVQSEEEFAARIINENEDYKRMKNGEEFTKIKKN